MTYKNTALLLMDYMQAIPAHRSVTDGLAPIQLNFLRMCCRAFQHRKECIHTVEASIDLSQKS